MDKLISMETFLTVSDKRSFAAAAETLQMSKAMASKHIAQLESRIGVQLMHRNTRGVRLTEAGHVYRHYCESILTQLAEAEAHVASQHNEPRGMLRVVAPYSFGVFQLTPALIAYKERCAEVQVHLTLDDQSGDIVEQGFDVAVRVGKLRDSSLVARPIGSTTLVVCGAPAYLHKHGRPQSLEDLRQHNCLRYARGRHRTSWLFESHGREIKLPVSGTFSASAAESVRIAAIKGHGLIQLPAYIVAKDLQEGDLQAVLAEFEPKPQPIHALYMKRQFLSMTVKSFVDFLYERFRDLPDQLENEAGTAQTMLAIAQQR